MNLMGLEEEFENEKTQSLNDETKKNEIRQAFHLWSVNGQEYKLKLQTGMIAALENKYRENLLNLIGKEGIPPLSVMLTILQGAMKPWYHGVRYQDIEKIYDNWVQYNGGSQTDLLAKVLIPTMAVSGFFTSAQAKEIMDALTETKELI